MICRYSFSNYVIQNCPPITGLVTGSGVPFPNTFAYFSNFNTFVSGFSTGLSYLNTADVLSEAGSLINLSRLAGTGCNYIVGVYYTGFCPTGTRTFAVSGSWTGVNTYIDYINAFKALTGIVSGVGGVCMV